MNRHTQEEQRDANLLSAYAKEIRMEWGAIEGTYKTIQTKITDPEILNKIETIIQHARKLGNFETASRRKVAP